MDEFLRRSYLKILGLDNFHSLSGFAVGERLQSQSQSESQSQQNTSDFAGIQLDGTNRHLPPLQNSLTDDSSGVKMNAPEPLPKSSILVNKSDGAINDPDISNQVAVPEIRFTLEFFRVSPEVLVVNEAPFSPDNSHQALVLNLLRAILHALDFPTDESWSSEIFRWPMDENINPGQSDLQQAMSALNGFIQRQQDQHKIRLILLFAERFRDLLADSEKTVKIFDSSVLKLIQTRSLYTLVRVPELKRNTWIDLQPLYGYNIAT